MTLRFHPLDAAGELPPGRLDHAVSWLGEAAAEIVPRLGLDRVDVVVAPTQDPVPGWDVSGHAHGRGRVTIGISTKPDARLRAAEPDRIDAAEQSRDAIRLGRARTPPLAIQLRAVLAHELHHVARSRGPGYGRTLGEALVSEGLAQCFEEEADCPTPNYATAVRGDCLGLLAIRARRDWDAFHYDHRGWFFGDRSDPTWPWSGGYSLGYVLVRRFLDETGTSASGAVHVASSTVRAASETCLAELIAAADREAA